MVPIDQVGYRYVDTGAIELTTGDVTLSLSRGEFRIIDGLIYVAMSAPVTVTQADGSQGVVAAEQLTFVGGELDQSAMMVETTPSMLAHAVAGTTTGVGAGWLFWAALASAEQAHTQTNAAPAFSSGTTASVAEGTTATGYTAAASDADGDTVSYSLGSGNDEALFAINSSTGALSFQSAPDFEAPGDADSDNAYVVEVVASDGNGGSTSRTVTVSVTGLNDNSPAFSSGTTASVAEGTTATGYTAAASDADGDTVSYGLGSGNDEALFAINSSTGALSFQSAPDFEAPGDADSDNAYVVEVVASDGNGGSTSRTVTVSVTDVAAANPTVVTLHGQNSYDETGFGSSGAGDINNDGYDDVIVGAWGADPNGLNGAGKVYAVFGSAAGWPTTIELASLDGTNGFVLNGVTAGDQTGWNLSQGGDVNNDGIDDFLIGGYNGNESYVVFGNAAGFGASFELSSLDGTNGFAINTSNVGKREISSAGDMNNDGIDDIIVGAISDEKSYVIYGKTSAYSATLDVSTIDGTNGFVLEGVAASDQFGRSVSTGGDVNGDGYDDLIIGAMTADPNGNSQAGESYVVFGSAAGFGASFDLSTLDGTNGFAMKGVLAGDRSGYNVSTAGDLNGDGYDDVMVGAYAADISGMSNAGAAYVVYGKASGFAASIDLSALDGSNGFTLAGVSAGNYTGHTVAAAGDVNGDGLDDALISAYLENSAAGVAYVLFGTTNGFGANFDLSTFDGINGFVINGGDAGDRAGMSIEGAGDVNGDGFDDIVVGADNADSNGVTDSGEAYIIFGREEFTASVDLDWMI